MKRCAWGQELHCSNKGGWFHSAPRKNSADHLSLWSPNIWKRLVLLGVTRKISCEVGHESVEFSGAEPFRHCQPHPGAFMDGRHLDSACSGSRHSARNSHQPQAGAAHSDDHDSEHYSNHPEPGTLRLLASCAMDWGTSSEAGNSRSSAVRAFAAHSEYLRWDCRRGPGCGRSGARYGTHGLAIADESRIAARKQRDPRWNSRRSRDFRGTCDYRCGDWGRWIRRADFPRPCDGEQLRNSGGRNSGCVDGADSRCAVGLGGTTTGATADLSRFCATAILK